MAKCHAPKNWYEQSLRLDRIFFFFFFKYSLEEMFKMGVYAS